MKEKVINLIKDSNVTFPKLLLFNYTKLNINEKELVILIYLFNEKDLTFNPKKISSDLNYNLEEVMNLFETLISKNLIKLENKKVNGVRTEKVSLDELYLKLSYFVMDEEEKKETTIYDVFEEKFGRTLSPMEYTIIGGWLELGYSEELVLLALDEAIYNGVYKLNYIDKILYEWNRKGIKNKTDRLKYDTEFKKAKSEKKELVDYNWLDEN